jgi:hypothetical protein
MAFTGNDPRRNLEMRVDGRLAIPGNIPFGLGHLLLAIVRSLVIGRLLGCHGRESLHLLSQVCFDGFLFGFEFSFLHFFCWGVASGCLSECIGHTEIGIVVAHNGLAITLRTNMRFGIGVAHAAIAFISLGTLCLRVILME